MNWISTTDPQQALQRLLQDYTTLIDVPDELMTPDGEMRPAWRDIMHHIAQLGPDSFAQAIAQGERYLREAGVHFVKPDKDRMAQRDWPLCPLPIQLSESEWQTISNGLIERANLLEAVTADLYGDNRLVAEGHLPASFIARNPGWLRPLVGVPPRGGAHLHFVAFELGRGPDGRWWVLSDRTQAPSGAGFALENRVATSRIYDQFYQQSQVQRLAGFFRAFRNALQGQSGLPNGRVGVLSPGPMTETYYEHAYIARYLGMVLLEGGDLTVENGNVYVRTVSGLVPIDVLWRRIDASWVDPLELNSDSRLGTAGLLEALRAGSLSMINSLGAGAVEARGMLAFLPQIQKVLHGSPLQMPNIATWWCGSESALDHVLQTADTMVIGAAQSTGLPFEQTGPHAIGGQMINTEGQSLTDWITAEKGGLVGQEIVTLSTTPSFENGRLIPRPMALRVFLARGPQGWHVMPGGFARIGAQQDATAIALRQGSSVADVWVHQEIAQAKAPFLRPDRDTPVLPLGDTLPSRTADNMFWLGRYVERSAHILRLMRAIQRRAATPSDADVVAMASGLLRSFGETHGQLPIELWQRAMGCARQVRDRLSVDAWSALRRTEDALHPEAAQFPVGEAGVEMLSENLRVIGGFAGLVHESMYRLNGWRFLSLGRSLERTANTAALLAEAIGQTAPDGAMEMALEVCDSTMIHQQRYFLQDDPATLCDVLGLDASNPSGLLFNLERLLNIANSLPARGEGMDFAAECQAIYTGFAMQTATTVTPPLLTALRDSCFALSDQLSKSYLR